MRPWLAYTLIRVGVFAVAFAVLMVLTVPWYFSAVIAAALGFCVAYIFFRGLRDRVALELADARAGKGRKRPDEDVEDLVD